MNKFMIAATSLVLASGAAYAQDTANPQDPGLMQQAETAAKQSAQEAGKAAEAAGAAVENAAKNIAEASSNAADAAADSAAKAADSAAEAAGAAADVAHETMATGGQGSGADMPMTEGNDTTMPAGEIPVGVDAAGQPAEVVEAEPVMADPALIEKATGSAAVLSAENPGMLGSWVMNRHIWTTNQPSDSAMMDAAPAERPAEWSDIAKVDDVVIGPDGDMVGYVADIGGFLGIGAKKVLLGADQLTFMQIGDEAFYVTNMTKEELEGLPEFDKQIVLQ